MIGPEWYKKAWESLWRYAEDDEANMIEAIAVRAGLLWKCECQYCNGDDVLECENCGEVKP